MGFKVGVFGMSANFYLAVEAKVCKIFFFGAQSVRKYLNVIQGLFLLLRHFGWALGHFFTKSFVPRLMAHVWLRSVRREQMKTNTPSWVSYKIY